MGMSDNNVGKTSGWQGTDTTPIPVLEEVRVHGRAWEELAPQYGVTNPDPPWKIDLETTCDMLAADSCVKSYDEIEPGSCVLPALERRAEEDDLSETIYADVPFPERQLLALAHSMLKRGLFTEEELARQIELVGQKLKSA